MIGMVWPLARAAAGLVLAVFCGVAGIGEVEVREPGLLVLMEGKAGGVTLSPFAFIAARRWRWEEYARHEIGHVRQAQEMDARAYMVVELVSLAAAVGVNIAAKLGGAPGRAMAWYERLPWEVDADERGRGWNGW